MKSKRTNTKMRISTEALALFVRQGVDGTSIKDIARACELSEGALYRHFESKDQLAWEIFHFHYTSLARALTRAHQPHPAIADKITPIVACFCQYADEQPDGFAYCMLTQHGFLERFGDEPLNPVHLLCDVVAQAIDGGDIPAGDPTLLAAMAMGVVLQPATFKLYGRLTGDLQGRVGEFSRAIHAILFERAA